MGRPYCVSRSYGQHALKAVRSMQCHIPMRVETRYILFSLFLGFSIFASAHQDLGCETELANLRTVSVTFTNSITFHGQSLIGTYSFKETPDKRFIDVDGFFGKKGRPGLKNLFSIFANLDSDRILIDPRLRDVKITVKSITSGGDETRRYTGLEFVKKAWREANHWSDLPFLPAGPQSLLTVYGAEGKRVDDGLKSLAEKYAFETLPFGEQLSFGQVREFFETQYRQASNELLGLRLETDSNKLPYGINRLLRKAANGVRSIRTRRIDPPESEIINFDNMTFEQKDAIQNLRTPIRAKIQELRVALRVDNLLGFSKTLNALLKDRRISQFEFDALVQSGINPEREFDILSESGLFEVKSQSPMISSFSAPLNSEEKAREDAHFAQRREAQARIQTQVAEVINQQLESSIRANGGVVESDGAFELSTRRKFKRYVVYADGWTFSRKDIIPENPIGIIHEDGRPFR